MGSVIVTAKHLRKAKMCNKGTREFFKRHNIAEWSEFIRHGVSSEKLEATGDAMALRLVEIARGRR